MWKLFCGDSAVERYLGYLTDAAIDLLTGKPEDNEGQWKECPWPGARGAFERKRPERHKSEFVERFPELSLFFKAYSLLDSEMICIFPYLCPYAESAREIREIFS